MSSRIPVSRWASLVAWAAAVVTWGAVGIGLQEYGAAVVAAELSVAPPDPVPVTTTTVALAPVPTLPEEGLVVLTYTAVPPPPPERIVRRVVVAGSSTSPTASTKPVKSSGS